MRIYLIGMPGVGKTTTGKQLAQELNYKFVDLDSLIEQKAFMFIEELFSAYGEKFFRDLESNVLAEMLLDDNIVVSCGGGIIKKKKNKRLMEGKICYLVASLETISNRLANSDIVRPLLGSTSLEELFLERSPHYEAFADIKVNAESSILAITKEIKEQL